MNDDMEFTIVRRRSWNACPPVGPLEPLKHPVKFVFCLNTHSDPCTSDTDCEDRMRRLQVVHTKDGKTPDLRSNFVIGEDGRVFEGRGWNYQPTLPFRFSKYNPQSLLISFVGRYEEATLPRIMTKLREDLVEMGIQNNYIDKDFEPVELFEQLTNFPYSENRQ